MLEEELVLIHCTCLPWLTISKTDRSKFKVDGHSTKYTVLLKWSACAGHRVYIIMQEFGED